MCILISSCFDCTARTVFESNNDMDQKNEDVHMYCVEHRLRTCLFHNFVHGEYNLTHDAPRL